MEKWYFSDNGQVSGPLTLEEAREELAKNPNVYGWTSSLNQWKPVNCISEFADIVPAAEQSLLVPKELTEKFLAKKKRLQGKLTSIEDSIKHTESTFGSFEKQIENYKKLTVNLNDDVKAAINNIEKKHSSLTKKLSQVKNAIDIAEDEIDDAIKSFDQRVNSNDVFMPSFNGVQPSRSNDENSNISSIDNAPSKAKIAESKLAKPHKRVDLKEVEATEKPSVQSQKAEEQQLPPDVQLANKMASESFEGMKNMMKSVFKGDNKVKADSKAVAPQPEKKQTKAKDNDKPLSMAERLKLAQNNQ